MAEANTGSNASSVAVKIDLSNYALSSETATKVDLEALQAIVANKLDKEPMHTHSIAEVDDLQTELNAKYDITKKYSYATILNDSEKIPYLEDVKIVKLDVTTDKETKGYIFQVDKESGDLQIYHNSVCILSYNKAEGHWIMGEIDLNNFISEVNDTLVNHCEALKIIMQSMQEDTNEESNEE